VAAIPLLTGNRIDDEIGSFLWASVPISRAIGVVTGRTGSAPACVLVLAVPSCPLAGPRGALNWPF